MLFVLLIGLGLLNVMGMLVLKIVVDVVGNDVNVVFDCQFFDFNMYVLDGYVIGGGFFKM